MTTPEIIARNRANGSKSTGPRTPEGKAAVSGNAIRHGATSRPDPSAVAIWLRVILDAPDLDLSSVSDGGGRVTAALTLAEAEVRVVQAERALREFEADWEEEANRTDLQDRRLDAIAGLKSSLMTDLDTLTALRLIAEIGLEQNRREREAKRQQRTLKRYLREARSARRRAFRNWLGHLP